MARGDSLTSVWGGMDVELIGLKGERMVDSSYTKADRFYLAWRDDRRISIRGFPTKEEAEEVRASLRGDVEAEVVPIGGPLGWFEEMAQAGAGKSGKSRRYFARTGTALCRV